jgi:hypothetical protein
MKRTCLQKSTNRDESAIWRTYDLHPGEIISKDSPSNPKEIRRVKSFVWMNFHLSIFLLFMGSATIIKAQDAIPASGGNSSGSGGSVSYTVGQVSYSSVSDTGGTVSEGVQQPYEIFVITGLDQFTGITLNLFAYPNPTTNSLTLKVDDFNLNNLSFILSDLNGKILTSNLISEEKTSVEMGYLVSATYFLTVKQGNSILKTFKIIKN